MKIITILDTSICSTNLGDQIIMDSIRVHLSNLCKDRLFVQVPTHDWISKESHLLMQQSEKIIIGGTNLLSSNMNSYKQWKIGFWDSLFVNNIMLMGVGWWQYQQKPNYYTKLLYNRLLSDRHLHSVRDSYTEQQLRSIGFSNVINTACPTMWDLTPEHCATIPKEKSNSVLVTFTEYNQKKEDDAKVIDLLTKEYEHIFFWTQQPKDYEYMQGICGERATYIQPSLKALDKILCEGDMDYIGTRLHAGIRALQHKKRTLILAVDNRAAEIAKDTNLPVIQRDDINGIEKWIYSKSETHVKLPDANIKEWKSQFK
jgi:polysaccharide pyruvyl transferase WcaK-like protein